MDAYEIIDKAEWMLEHGDITLGEYNDMICPLRDVEAVVRCKDCYKKETVNSEEGTSFYWCLVHGHATDEWRYCDYGEIQSCSSCKHTGNYYQCRDCHDYCLWEGNESCS